MVEQIYDKETIDKYLNEDRPEEFIRLRLSHTYVQKWKDSGKFKAIKRELNEIPNLKFACITDNEGCSFIFIHPNIEMLSRIGNLLMDIRKGYTQTRITETGGFFHSDKVLYPDMPDSNPTSCLLFE